MEVTKAVGWSAIAMLLLGNVFLTSDEAVRQGLPTYTQQVMTEGPGYHYRYRVQISFATQADLRVNFSISNQGRSDLLALIQQDLIITVREDCAIIRMGSPASHYGNDIPFMELVGRSEVSYEEVVQIPSLQEELRCLEFVFFDLVDNNSGLVSQLSALDTDGSVWFTKGNLDLTERFQRQLESHAVRIPLR